MPNGQPIAPPESAQGTQGGGGDVGTLVAGIHDGLVELLDLVSKSPATTDQDAEGLASILQGYRTFVEQNLLAEQDAPAQEGAGLVPSEAGAGQTRPF